ncbi:MAG TPA: winged helix DNA-binding domain-containing protein [Candidatus Dormibacteraeota bacterium]|nr:winged helix DNA-binding domain-containing protein [Candidatus Dormibacteraeota bacterium]
METLGPRALNRALLARQGLLEPFDMAPELVAARIGAIQAQYWPSVAVALWARTGGLDRAAVDRALSEGRLLLGSLLRGTLHVVPADQHPAYAVTSADAGETGWRKIVDHLGFDAVQLRADALAHIGAAPTPLPELGAHIEKWLHRTAPELDGDAQLAVRRGSWRWVRSTAPFVRASTAERWTEKAPDLYRAAPYWLEETAPDPDQALAEVVRIHLGAFGPASAQDLAYWIGERRMPRIKAALEALDPAPVGFRDEAGRELWDLSDAPRPDPDTEAPPRLLPWFDSTMLAYHPSRREHLVPERCRDVIYLPNNLQILPTILIDGMVADTWTLTLRARAGALELKPVDPVGAATRRRLLAEGERLLEFLRPAGKSNAVTLAS